MSTLVLQEIYVQVWQPLYNKKLMSKYGNPYTTRKACPSMATLVQQELHIQVWQPLYNKKLMSKYGNPYTTRKACPSMATLVQRETYVQVPYLAIRFLLYKGCHTRQMLNPCSTRSSCSSMETRNIYRVTKI